MVSRAQKKEEVTGEVSICLGFKSHPTNQSTPSGIYHVYLKVTDAKGNTTQSETARIEAAAVPVGGYIISIQAQATVKSAASYTTSLIILTAIFMTIKRTTKKKR